MGVLLVGRVSAGALLVGRVSAGALLAAKAPAAKALAGVLPATAEVLAEARALAASAEAVVAKAEVLVEAQALAASPCVLEVSLWQLAVALTRSSVTLSHEPTRIAVVARGPMVLQLALPGRWKRLEGERVRPMGSQLAVLGRAEQLEGEPRARVRRKLLLVATLVRPAPPAGAALARTRAPSKHQGRYV